MKKILIAILLMMCVIITGCTVEDSSGETVEISSGETVEIKKSIPFKKVYGGTNFGIYIDVETNVMYVTYYAGSGAGGITVMVDQDGKPRLWEE